MRNVLFIFFQNSGTLEITIILSNPFSKKKPTSLSEPKKQTLVSALTIEE